MLEELQLEININIGNDRYVLQVPKRSNLPEVVSCFLLQNHLDQRYHHHILEMVHQELEKRAILTTKPTANLKQTVHDPIDQMRRARDSIERKKENAKSMMNKTTPIKPFVQDDRTKYNTANSDLVNHSDEISIAKEQEESYNEAPSCEKVYERWKLKERAKNKEIYSSNKSLTKRSGKLTPNAREKPIKERSSDLSPGYFYNRGILIEKLKEEEITKKFQEVYPFTTNRNIRIASRQKQLLHQRLFKEAEAKRLQAVKNEMNLQRAPTYQRRYEIAKKDPIKLKISQKRREIDQLLSECIDKGKIAQRTEIRSVSKSPFRKTRIF